ncbi:MAG: cyclic nucleotide-binding domain-containing protein [Patescibacteria group bacterium]
MSLILQILKTVPFFESLTDEENETVMAHIVEEFYPANYKLFSKGDFGDRMYIIKSGKVRISDEGKVLAELEQGSFFGEMALIEATTRNATAETETDTELFVLKTEDVNSLLRQRPEIGEKIKEAYRKRKAKP